MEAIVKLDLASRAEGGQVTAPIRTQCHTKSSDNQSQRCNSKSLHLKSSTKEGWSSTSPLKEIGCSIRGPVNL